MLGKSYLSQAQFLVSKVSEIECIECDYILLQQHALAGLMSQHIGIPARSLFCSSNIVVQLYLQQAQCTSCQARVPLLVTNQTDRL